MQTWRDVEWTQKGRSINLKLAYFTFSPLMRYVQSTFIFLWTWWAGADPGFEKRGGAGGSEAGL